MKYGIDDLKPILRAAGIRVHSSAFISIPTRVVLYGCSATSGSNHIVNDSEKERVRPYLEPSSDRIVWLMRLDNRALEGLKVSSEPDSVWLFPAPQPFDDMILAPTRSKGAARGRSISLGCGSHPARLVAARF
jgi:hypothetical protein